MSTARSVGYASIGNLLAPLASLATQPMLAQGLGVEGRGLLAAATVPLLFASAALTLGLPEALTQYVAQRAASRSLVARTLGLGALGGLLGTVGIVLLAGPLSAGNESLRGLVVLAAAFVAPVLFTAGLRGVVAGRSQWGWIAAARLTQALLQLVCIGVLVWRGSLTTLNATIVICSAQCVGSLVFLGALSRPIADDSTSHAVPVRDRDVVSYGLRMWPGAVAGILNARLDQLLIVPLSSVAQLGLYSVSASISEVAMVASWGLRDVLFASESRERSQPRVAFATRVGSLAVALMALLIAVVSPWAVPWAFGDEFSGSLPSLLVLLLAIAVASPGSIVGMALAGWGRPELRSIAWGAAAAINLLGILALVPLLGALGAALATLVGNTVASILNLGFMRRKFGVSIREMTVPILADARTLAGLLGRRFRPATGA